MKITYIGHSTILIEDEDFNILIDPFFANNFLGLKRKLLPAVSVKELPRIDLILISHTHPDHCDYKALKSMSKSSAVIMPKKTSAKVEKTGFRVTELDYRQSTEIGKYKITVVPAKHQGICAGFIIEGNKTVYFAGDTYFIPAMTEIGNKFNIDVALLPIGGNRFFGKKMLMDPQDATLAASELKSKIIIPIHYETFGKIPLMLSMKGTPSDFINEIKDDKIKKSVKVLNIGECLNIG